MHSPITKDYRHNPHPKHPSVFASPFLAMTLAGVIALSAVYASYLRGNLFEELEKDYRATDFQSVVIHSKLKQDFEQSDWNYTLPAPTDHAFDKAQWVKA